MPFCLCLFSQASMAFRNANAKPDSTFKYINMADKVYDF